MAKVLRLIKGQLKSVSVDQEAAIAISTSSLVVNFPATLQTGNATPRVVAWMINTTDTNPQFQTVEITARSSTSFTAKWNAPVDSSNYKLAYIVVDGFIV